MVPPGFASLLRDALTLVPSELSAQLDQAQGSPFAVVAFAACLGTWLGSRHAEDLPLHLKLLAFGLMEATVLCDNLVRFTRTDDAADLLFPGVHWHAPFVASFIVSRELRPPSKSCG